MELLQSWNTSLLITNLFFEWTYNIVQTVLILSALNLKGGTNADMAPQVDEFTEVFLQNLKHFGPNVEFEEIFIVNV